MFNKEILQPLDLVYGDPQFMLPYWEKTKVDGLGFARHLGYQFRPSSLLKEEIKLLHENVRNANITQKDVVIGNGAKQVLYAAMYAMQRVYGYEFVTASSPYFPRFPKMAELAGLHWASRWTDESLQIITSPNNPDGKLQDSVGPNLIHDLVYNWPQYVSIGVIPEDREIMVFGLSKATGHASTRIGWALVRNPKLVEAMEEYIEFTTSGVSIEAQESAFSIIKHCNSAMVSPFSWGASILNTRWKHIHTLSYRFPFEIESSNGMFMWLKLKDRDKFFADRNILFTPGESCGSDEYHARLNIGCSNSDFELLIDRLLKI